MIRTNHFDQTKAINQAMKLFWSKGYETITMKDILEATELSVDKFKEIFGSKDRLYLAAFNYFSF
jgi:TetR/AcrR family transcriptional repressor of nem operon